MTGGLNHVGREPLKHNSARPIVEAQTSNLLNILVRPRRFKPTEGEKKLGARSGFFKAC